MQSELYLSAYNNNWDQVLLLLDSYNYNYINNEQDEIIKFLYIIIKQGQYKILCYFILKLIDNNYISIIDNNIINNTKDICYNENSIIYFCIYIKVLDTKLLQDIYNVQVRSCKRFSFLHVNKIIPYPNEYLECIKYCINRFTWNDLIEWFTLINPYHPKLKHQDVIIPDNTSLFVLPLNDLHISIDTPCIEAIDKYYSIQLSHLTIYPLGNDKRGKTHRKCGKHDIFYPLLWCTIEVYVKTSIPVTLIPRNHSHFHISFAQIGYKVSK